MVVTNNDEQAKSVRALRACGQDRRHHHVLKGLNYRMDGIQPVLDERGVEPVRRVVLSGWVRRRPEVAAFESEFAAYVGAPHACAVSNCTTAAHLAPLAVGVGAGDNTTTPGSATPPACCHRQRRGRPIASTVPCG